MYNLSSAASKLFCNHSGKPAGHGLTNDHGPLPSRCSCRRPPPESQQPTTPPAPRLEASRKDRPRVLPPPARPHGRRQRCRPGHAAAAARVAEHRGGGGAEPPRGGRHRGRRRRVPGPGDAVVPLREPGAPPHRARRLRRGLRAGRRGGRGLALRHRLPRGRRHRHPRRRGRLHLRGGLRPRRREGN